MNISNNHIEIKYQVYNSDDDKKRKMKRKNAIDIGFINTILKIQ